MQALGSTFQNLQSATHGSGRLVLDMSDVIMTLVLTSDEELQDIYGHFA